MEEFKVILGFLAWCGRTVRHVKGGKRLLRAVRGRITHPLLREYHEGVIHSMRGLAMNLDGWPAEEDPASEMAVQFCTKARVLLGHLLELGENHLHCCLKMAVPGENHHVATWVRSRPFDQRPTDRGFADSHPVGGNTVWSAFYGTFDGFRQWEEVRLFCCNDLVENSARFACTRPNWQTYYKSTLVFPLRLLLNEARNEYLTMGFLAFDSPQKGAFAGMPDIYDHLDDLSTYYQTAIDTPVYHIGAAIADTLSVFLRPSYQLILESPDDDQGDE